MEKRVLIERWLGRDAQPIPIYDEASVSSARERVRAAGRQLGFDRELVESVALIASELTHNHLAHARQGYFAVRPVNRRGVQGLEVTAADLGPGLGGPFLGNRGYADRVSLGAGLESVFRIADEVALDSRSAEGLCVVARKFESPPEPLCEVAIAGKPYPGEGISGDDGVFFQFESGMLGAIADGLGHGPEAREASNLAMDVVSRHRDLGLDEILMAANSELATTRGCAMAVARFNRKRRTLDCVAVGDVHAHLYTLRDAHFFTSTPLILGEADLRRRRARVESVTAAPGSVLVMFTDGLRSRATLKGELDILRQPPAVIAQHLIAEHARDNDDALVLVARFRK